MKKIFIIAVVGAVIIAGGAFYGGMQYSKSQTKSGFNQRMQGFQPNDRTDGKINSMTIGEILLKDEKSITVKLQDGGSKIILFSDATNIGKYVNGNKDDLIVGESVTVNGTTNSDGSITAQSIQIRPTVQPGK